ncbi:uncharacterized protein LOC108667143 isoform X1 [Hyalella azteca]|nr:uncharacterized protein LOC108667143 isoform X1 [Hyalella azteca]
MSPRSPSSASALPAGATGLPANFVEAHRKMLSWVHSQRRLLPPPKFMFCLSDKKFPNRDVISGEIVRPEMLCSVGHRPRSILHNTPSCSGGSHGSSDEGGNVKNKSNERTNSLRCPHSGNHPGSNIEFRSLPDQGSLSSEDNRSPLTLSSSSRDANTDTNTNKRSRHRLCPSDHSVPTTPSLSPNARSPSILKRSDSSPKIPQSASMELVNEGSVSKAPPALADPPRRSALKKHRAIYGSEAYPEVELQRSSPDGCSRIAPHSNKSLNNYSNDLSMDYPLSSLKFSSVPNSCSSCNQSPCCSFDSYNSVNISPRYSSDAESHSSQSNAHGIESHFSPMLKSYEQLLLDQSVHRSALSDEANKTLEAVENDLRELCNLPRTKHLVGSNHFSSSLTRQDSTPGNLDENSSKPRFSRLHGSLKRRSEKSSKPAFDRTRSAVDLTLKNEENFTTASELARNMSSGNINYKEDVNFFNDRNMESIGRSISAKSLILGDTTSNDSSRKNSTVYEYCTSSLPKRRNVRNFRNSLDEPSPPTTPGNFHAEDSVIASKTPSFDQAVHYMREQYHRQHESLARRRQSVGSKTNQFSSLPYCAGYNKPSPEARGAGSDVSYRNAGMTDVFKGYPGDMAYSPSGAHHFCGQTSGGKFFQGSQQYYYHKMLSDHYDPGIQMSGNMSRPLAYHQVQERTAVPSNADTFERFTAATPNHHCHDPGCGQCGDARFVGAPVESQKDITIPNYFSNNSKGSVIPASLMPRYQIRNEEPSKHFNDLGKENLVRMDSRYGTQHPNNIARDTPCSLGCTHEPQSVNMFYGHEFHGSCQPTTPTNKEVHGPTNATFGQAIPCCDHHRPQSFQNFGCNGRAHKVPTSMDPRSNRRPSQHYSHDQTDDSTNAPTTWSWEQRIADVEKSYPDGGAWSASSAESNEFVKHQLQQRRFTRADSTGAERFESHAQGCAHFGPQAAASNREMQTKLADANRRRSLSKELAGLALDGPPRRTISCLPTNIVRNAFISHDPSYKLLKHDPDDESSEAGTAATSADKTTYRYV